MKNSSINKAQVTFSLARSLHFAFIELFTQFNEEYDPIEIFSDFPDKECRVITIRGTAISIFFFGAHLGSLININKFIQIQNENSY